MSENLVAVVEIPKGSSNKYEWDEELGAIKLDRLLFSSLGYPTDYGFFRDTLAADGDPLDAMIAVSEPTFPGCLIEVKPVALFRMRDQKAEDNKILCVPHTDPNWSHIERLEDLSMTLRDEISHFFSIYKTPEWKVVKVDGWYSREEAERSIERARRRWREARAGLEREDRPGVGAEEAAARVGVEPEVVDPLERLLGRDHRPVRAEHDLLAPVAAAGSGRAPAGSGARCRRTCRCGRSGTCARARPSPRSTGSRCGRPTITRSGKSSATSSR